MGDIEGQEWAKAALAGLAAAYASDEPEYDADMLKEINLEYRDVQHDV